MTLGQRIQEERKRLGLSQEGLGEALGVTRQAISKWEADGAVPELDKLVALSRLFSLPVGVLLGVEHLVEPEGGELAPREEHEGGGGGAEPPPPVEPAKKAPGNRRRRLWPGVAAALAVVCLVLGWQVARLWGQVNGLTDGMILSTSVALKASQVELQQQELDAENGIARYQVTLCPSTITKGMKVELEVQGEGMESTTVQATQDGDTYLAELALPLIPEVELTAVLVDRGGGRHRVELDPITGLDQAAEPLVTAVKKEPWDTLELGVWDLVSTIWVSCRADTDNQYVWLTDASLCLYCNGVRRWKQELPLEDGGIQTWVGAESRQVSVQKGDDLCLVFEVTDSLGRSTSHLVERVAITEGELGLELNILETDVPNYTLPY